MNASGTPVGLQVDGLRVVYDGFVAVDDASFAVQPGESFGIVGESGSGKSTVLRAVCGLAPRAAGHVRLLGSDAAPGSKAFRRQVQMVFQDPYGSLHPRQTVDRILAEPLAIHGIDDAQARIQRALDEVGLGEGFRFRYCESPVVRLSIAVLVAHPFGMPRDASGNFLVVTANHGSRRSRSRNGGPDRHGSYLDRERGLAREPGIAVWVLDTSSCRLSVLSTGTRSVSNSFSSSTSGDCWCPGSS